MIIADIIEFIPRKTDNQKQTATCVGQALMGNMREQVQQVYGVDVDFDILKIFDQVDNGGNPNMLRVIKFLRAAMQGFMATDGSIVKITGYKSLNFAADDICESLQTYGPAIMTVKMYNEMNLSPNGSLIFPKPTNDTLRDSTHEMQIIGFDRIKKLYKIQNSYAEKNNIKYISFDALHEILVDAYAILGIRLFPKINQVNMITPLSQRDSRWANVKIGKSNVTVGEKGCTITSICMALEKLRGYAANPGDAAYFWKFTADGKIIWNDSHFEGAKFIWRGYDADWSKISEFVMDENKAAIVAVNNSTHWLFVEGFTDGTIEIIDPIDGQRYEGLPDKYKICGYALFEKNPL